MERNLSKELRQKLQQATEELAKKSAVEREQKEAKEYLRTHLERERQTVDFLRVQLTSKDQHIREVEVMKHMLGILKSRLDSSSLFPQHQVSTARAEQECNTKKIGQHKLIISQKEEKIKTLSQELQKQESLIAKLERGLAAAREGGATRELELLQRIVKVTDEAAGLRDKLEEAKEEKWEAVRKMEAAQVENKLLQGWMTELRGQKTAYKVSCIYHNILLLVYYTAATIIVWLHRL